MSDNSSNEQLENVKRHAAELVDDMRSRKLLLPAIVLLMAIVAAFIVLPKPSQPVESAAAPATPVANQPEQVKTVQISLLGPSSIGDGTTITDSANPFVSNENYTCTTVSNGDPKVLDCEIADLRVRVSCPSDASEPPCAASTSSSGGGSSGSTGGTSVQQTPSDSENSTNGSSVPTVIYVYKANVQLDGKSYDNVEQGEQLPSSSNGLVTFNGVNNAATKAAFYVAEGTTVSGVTVDNTGQAFTMSVGQTATITTSDGKQHKLKLTKISKVKA